MSGAQQVLVFQLSELRGIAAHAQQSKSWRKVDGVEAKKMRAECLPIGTTDFPLLPGEIGCYAAHLRALQRIVDY